MIIRTPNRDRYVIISKVPLEDERLSWKARGLHAYLMSKPDNWNVIVEHLVKQSPDGKAAVMSGLRELEDLGYIRRTKRRRDGERFDGIDSEVFEEPLLPGQTESRFSVDGKAADGKSPTNEQIPLMNNEVTLAPLKNPPINATANTIYEAYPRKKDRAKAIRAIIAELRKGAAVTDMLVAIDAYACTITDMNFMKYPATFFRDSWREWVPTNPPSHRRPPDVDHNEIERRNAESVAPPKDFAKSVRAQLTGRK